MTKNKKKPKLSIDERLEALLQMSESLGTNMELLIDENRKQEEKFSKLRLAILKAISEFINESE